MIPNHHEAIIAYALVALFVRFGDECSRSLWVTAVETPFCASDAFGVIGGLNIMKNLNLTPDALSGVCSSSPLHIRELKEFTDIPVFNSAEPDRDSLGKILLNPSKLRRRK